MTQISENYNNFALRLKQKSNKTPKPKLNMFKTVYLIQML